MPEKQIIIRFEQSHKQTVGEITKIVGLVKARYFIPIIDELNLEANPRDSKTGGVTEAIQESIKTDTNLLPFKTKGLLLASSRYEELERGRVRISPSDENVEGILDGGHNTLAIGLYILEQALHVFGEKLPKGRKTWEEFKLLWQDFRHLIDDYQELTVSSEGEQTDLDFLIPVELIVPKNPTDFESAELFRNNLFDICSARNNNVQLNTATKANQQGYFDVLREMIAAEDPELSARIEWKTNAGGDIKVQDIVALAWIPLSLVSRVKDERNAVIEPPAPNKLYSGKGACLEAFKRLMSSDEVTIPLDSDYKRKLNNPEVESAFRVAASIPALYDYIFEKFPEKYNASGGNYGRITAVKKLNETRRVAVAPFSGRQIDKLSPDGFIVPLVYGLVELMEVAEQGGVKTIRWAQNPRTFLENNLQKVVDRYAQTLVPWSYDPQKVGKSPQSYSSVRDAYKMAKLGI